METVADSGASVGAACLEQTRHSLNALPGCLAPCFGDDLPLRQALLDEVVPANTRFCKMGVAAAASGGDNDTCQPAFFQVKGVVQARFEDRGRDAVVFRSPEDHNRVGGSGLVADSLSADGAIEQPLGGDDAEREDHQEEE